MKFSVILLSVTLYLVSSIEAGITTNTPFKSVTWNGGEDENVIWADDGKGPKLAEIGVVTIDLMAGGDTNQVLVDNIGKVPATAKQIDYTVPKDVGPPGSFYFIKYTAENFEAFSGTFSIANVNGEIEGFDPKDPNDPNAKTPTPAKGGVVPSTTITTTTTTLPSSSPKSPPANDPGAKAPATDNGAKTANNEPKSVQVPNTISSNSVGGLLPNFVGVSTVVVALALTYLC